MPPNRNGTGNRGERGGIIQLKAINYRENSPIKKLAYSQSDDPDVRPVRSERVKTQIVHLQVGDEQQLELSPSPLSYKSGEVEWSWTGDTADDFTLTFATPPLGWSPKTNSQGQSILLAPADPAAAKGSYEYTIETLNFGKTTGTIIIK